MLFMGGKGTWAKKIVAEIEPWRSPDDTLIEVCCGAANLTGLWTKNVVAIDLNPALIAMWKAGQRGWKPPPREKITKELFNEIRENPDLNNPLTAFMLFGCSFRGQWAAGYANRHWHSANRRFYDPVTTSINGLLRKFERTRHGVEFVCASYSYIKPLQNQVIYIDPPYFGTRQTGISGDKRSGVPRFDHDKFWQCARQWNEQSARVFVSEETAPNDFVRYRSWNAARSLGNWSEVDHNGSTKIESIWVHRDSEMVTKVRRHRRDK